MEILFARGNGFLDDVPVEKVRAFETAFYNFMDSNHPEIGGEITEKMILSRRARREDARRRSRDVQADSVPTS